MFLSKTEGIPIPTSGVGDDYTYSRHFSDPNSAKIFAYTIVHPPWNEGYEHLQLYCNSEV
ncbi:MAG TPA: hypothetical protein VFY68_15150 [Nitrososphaeraceae archaeon]|nr:hypothetical protein [Nitrososphaeraceae archaeon]